MRDSIAAARVSGPLAGADGTAGFEFQFDATDPVFAGHFPGRPVLPGVFQLEMVRAAMEWVLGGTLAVREVGKAKFQRPILPGERLRLELKWVDAEGGIRARAAFFVGDQRAGETVMTLWRNES